ncbi:MAG: hypothetical protein GXP10_04000 [Gammaproteobacteria bacterium]|nr:hypothetical protein [Gammaproteobacteria bacterium]
MAKKSTQTHQFCGALMLAIVAGCSADKAQQHVEKQQAGDITVAAITMPGFPEVGETVTMAIELSRAGQPVSGCKVGSRQYMPGMEMSSDQTVLALTEGSTTPGHYRSSGRSVEFTMGGDWVFEVQLDCADASNSIDFKYHLEWPE